MLRRILFLATLLGLSMAAFDSKAQNQEKPVYEVYAISYGVIPDFPVSSLVAGADPSRKMDIQMMVWLLKGPGGRNILVDSGFYRDKFFKQWKIKDFVKPSEAVAGSASNRKRSPTSSSRTCIGITPTASIFFPER